MAVWAVIFDQHHNAIWRYLCRRAGPTLADDLAGEVFLRALSSGREPDPDTDRAWLYGIATNLLRERSRKELRRLRAYARSAATEPVPFEIDGVVARVDAAAKGPALAAELARLERVDRDTLLLFALTELDYAGIAVAMEVPVGTVRSRLHRARRRLRAALGEPEPDFEPEPTAAITVQGSTL